MIARTPSNLQTNPKNGKCYSPFSRVRRLRALQQRVAALGLGVGAVQHPRDHVVAVQVVDLERCHAQVRHCSSISDVSLEIALIASARFSIKQNLDDVRYLLHKILSSFSKATLKRTLFEVMSGSNSII